MPKWLSAISRAMGGNTNCRISDFFDKSLHCYANFNSNAQSVCVFDCCGFCSSLMKALNSEGTQLNDPSEQVKIAMDASSDMYHHQRRFPWMG